MVKQKLPALCLHEQILLLALKDREGTIDWKAGYWPHALAGAMLTELVLTGRIEIEQGKKQFVNVADASPLGDPVLDDCLQKIATAKRRKQLQHWVSTLCNVRRLKHRVAEQLCRKHILREDEGTVLFFFTRKLYPEINPAPERAMIERLREAIFTDSDKIDPRTAVLIALANAGGLLSIPFANKDLKKRKKRLEEISRGELVGKATKQAIEAAQAAAAAMAAISATMIAVNAGS